MTAVSIIIPAHNEAAYIGPCLDAVLGSRTDAVLHIIVVANACTDDTVNIAHGFANAAEKTGGGLDVLQTATAGKLNAINLAEDGLPQGTRIYLDADVQVSPDLLAQLIEALGNDDPGYASGTPHVVPPEGRFLRAYTRFWNGLPFVAKGVPGFGIFALNSAGRGRWSRFPDIISDDSFVRLHFTPAERVRVAASYRWPMISGIANLIRVRRRQDAGVAEIAQRFPQLVANAAGSRPGVGAIARLAMRDLPGFLAYSIVSVAVRLPIWRTSERWARGR